MREERIDILRFLGLAMIILAHVGPPPVIFQLRNFDVPLMVLVSGMSFNISNKCEPYKTYVWKRIKRLLFPVWIFLSAYFLYMFSTGNPSPLPSAEKIINSYILLSGIGYVWIVRIFLLVAVASPALHWLSRNIRSNIKFLSVLIVICIGYELILLIWKPPLISIEGRIIESIVFYLIPYAIVFAFGLRIKELKNKSVLLLAVGFICVFVIYVAVHWLIFKRLIPTQEFKYPPSIYYLSFALSISCIAWFLSEKILWIFRCVGLVPPVVFVSENSLWIYLWHIPLIESLRMPFFIKFPIALIAASFAVFIQVTLVRRILLPRISNQVIKTNLNLIFTG